MIARISYLCVWEVISGAADTDIQFAGQVGELLVAQSSIEQLTVHLVQHGPTVSKMCSCGCLICQGCWVASKHLQMTMQDAEHNGGNVTHTQGYTLPCTLNTMKHS